MSGNFKLKFGTGGLRAVLGPDSDQMNEQNVNIATQGLAEYLLKNFTAPSVVIGYDSRNKSSDFAETAARVMASKGVKVYIWPELMPVPCVSFAVRFLRCSAGIMITASHNPAQYNGYKVYGNDGCQITSAAALAISNEIDAVCGLCEVNNCNGNLIEKIPDRVYDEFISEIKDLSVLFNDKTDKSIKIVYSPLNGAGLKPVTRVLSEVGYSDIFVVPEQEKPDGDFPTCRKPNPEEKDAMSLAIRYASEQNADLVVATDPDCDRVGIAVRSDSEDGDFVLLSGNEVGLLLLDYICSQRTAHGCMPEKPVFIKTVVTTDLAVKIAADYGVEVIETLTGFKYIGEQITKLENERLCNGGSETRSGFIFAFEESYGYLSGTHVRDKDGVNGVFLICEMFTFYKNKGVSLVQKLNEIYERYGFCVNRLHNYEFSGKTGISQTQEIMSRLEGFRHEQYAADVFKFETANGSFVVRPSGTEPKLKVYTFSEGQNRFEAEENEKLVFAEADAMIRGK